RPDWLPSTLGKDQASQLAGLAVGPIFPWYFLLQGVCGVLALATALPWTKIGPGQKLHRVRFMVLAAALLSVIIHWPLAQKVTELRAARYVIEATVAEAAKATFAQWHLYSLLLNFVTLGLVSLTVAFIASLPGSPADGAKPS